MTNTDVKKGTKRARILPYAYARRGLLFELQEATLDGEREAGNINEPNQLLRLETREWERAAIRFSISVKPDVVPRVLPRPEGRTTYPVHYLVAMRCESTMLRRGRLVDPAASALDVPTFVEFEIRRDELRDSAEFFPYLVRETDEPDISPQYARAAGARIADGRPWQVRVDPVERSRSQHLDIRYIQFSDHERFESLSDRIYILEADTEKPTLWLNRDHPRVVQVLDSEGTRGGSARVRDVFFDMITHGVWMQLFMRAAAGIDEHGETSYDWHRAVIDEFAPDLLPEYDATTRIEELRRRIRDPEQAPELLRDVDLHLQAEQDFARHMSRLVEEVLDG